MASPLTNVKNVARVHPIESPDPGIGADGGSVLVAALGSMSLNLPLREGISEPGLRESVGASSLVDRGVSSLRSDLSMDGSSSSSEGARSASAVAMGRFSHDRASLIKHMGESVKEGLKKSVDSHAAVIKILLEMKELGVDHFDLFEDTTFFSHIAKTVSPTALVVLLSSAILSDREKSQKAKDEIKEYLLSSSVGEIPLRKLLKEERANQIFDQLLDILDDEDINNNEDIRNLVTRFAFRERYDYLFFQPAECENMKESLNQCLKENQTSHEVIYSMTSHQEWMAKRANASTTLAAKYEPSSWVAVNHYILNPQLAFSLEMLKNAHKIMMVDELAPKVGEVDKRGKFRFEEAIIGSPSRGIVRSGTSRQLYCLPARLENPLTQFEAWVNEGIHACEENQMNPIVLAALASQRFLSLHPFTDGNGRMTRLLMDWVLLKFNLPPPILNGQECAPVFPFVSRNGSPDSFIQSIINGISESKKMILAQL